MKFIVLTLVSFLTISSATAASTSFDGWIGSWSGSCELTPVYNGVRDFKASLKIEPISRSKDLKWQLIYEANSNMAREVRNYKLLTIDENQGHYVVDENNGLFLDSYLRGAVLYSPFTINGKLITITYTLQTKNEMWLDMPMFGDTPIRKTCLSGNSNLCASSFALLSVQRCKLKRTN